MKSIYLLLLVLLCGLNSCKFYYKTADLDHQFKSSVENINSNCDKLTNQIKSYQKEFQAMNCSNSTEELKEANRMFEEINVQISELNKLKSVAIKSYYDFANYTKGKTEIQSGTEEWRKFKSTKKLVKNSVKLIQKNGNRTVSEAEKLNTYISEKIAPTIQKCNTKDFEKTILNELDSLSKLQKEYPEKAKKYTVEVEKIATLYKSSQPDKYQTLTDELKSLDELNKDLNSISENVKEIHKSFASGVKGKEFIYSCSSDWNIVKQTEEKIKKEEQRLIDLNLNSQRIQLQIQNTLNSFKQ